jgi:ketosteroid isomerase-like protein
MSSENEKVVRNAYQRAEDQDLDGFVNCFTADGTFTDQSIGVTYQGQEIAFTVQNYATAFSDMHRELFRFYDAADNIVVVQLALQGTHNGPLNLPVGTIPPTGKRMDTPCADIFELVNGKIRRFDCYPSASIVMAQLGILENVSAHIQP